MRDQAQPAGSQAGEQARTAASTRSGHASNRRAAANGRSHFQPACARPGPHGGAGKPCSSREARASFPGAVEVYLTHLSVAA